MCTLPIQAQAEDFNYSINEGIVTITGYSGPGGEVVIPSSIAGLPVVYFGWIFAERSDLTSVIVPATVPTIGSGAFRGCSNLTNIVISDGVISIEESALEGCTSLKNVYIPASVAYIEAGYRDGFVFTAAAFDGCSSLSAILVDSANPFYSSVDGVLFSKDQTKLIRYPAGKTGPYTMPPGVQDIGIAFERSTGLTRITLSDSIDRISAVAFAGCTGLTTVTIPESVTEIGTWAFSDCTQLKSVVLGGNIASIKAQAFARCDQLTAVYLTGSFPNSEPTAFSSEFTSYYVPGIPVFGGQWAGRPTAPWRPRIDSAVPGAANDFGFTITWTGGQSLLVESCTNLTSPVWVRLQLSTLTNDSIRFEDQNWTKHPIQFYRLLTVELPTHVIPVTNMVFIPPGEFTMGSPITEAGRWDDEGPQTPVTISRGFWMGRYEVTQGEYREVMGTNPSFHNGLKNGTNYGTDLSRPVEQVRWGNAVAYCDALTAREQAAGRLPAGYAYRLPTEAEWEYSCRAGTTTPFYLGEDLRSGMANFHGRFEYPPCGDSLTFCTNASGVFLGRTVSVGSYGPNPWGLHDMMGNVSEWCQDWFSDNYSGVPEIDPLGPATGIRRTSRGSSWRHQATALRSALRDYGGMEYRGDFTGFRVVLAPTP